MQVSIISTSAHGGAGKAAYRLHQGLISIGVENKFFSNNGGNTGVRFRKPSFLRRMARRLGLQASIGIDGTARAKSKVGFEFFSDCRSELGRRMQFDMKGVDIINLHWVARFVDLPSFLDSFGGRIPIVWTLHDMQPFTGGCHYAQECQKFKTACQVCPQLVDSGINDASAEIFAARIDAMAKLSDVDLHIVSPSNWLRNIADSSFPLSRFPKSLIPNGLNTLTFRPIPRAVAREALGLPGNKQLLLFVADMVANPRKGIAILYEALRIAAEQRGGFELLTVGSGDQVPPEVRPATEHYFGQINDERLMAIIYSAADVFVLPSLQDNLPNTMIEAIACGTPVVGFPVGGIPDVVRPGLTGWVAESVTADDLAEVICEALEEVNSLSRADELRASCRRIAEIEYSLEVQARSYAELFGSLLGNQSTHQVD